MAQKAKRHAAVVIPATCVYLGIVLVRPGGDAVTSIAALGFLVLGLAYAFHLRRTMAADVEEARAHREVSYANPLSGVAVGLGATLLYLLVVGLVAVAALLGR